MPEQHPGSFGPAQPSRQPDHQGWPHDFGPPTGPAAYPPPPPVTFPPPVAAARSDRNWLGVASLVLGLLGGGILGAIFGGFGVSAANQGRATNKTMAVWGLVLNIGMPVLLLGIFLVVGLTTDEFDKDRVPYDQVAVGECVQEPSGWDGETTDEAFSTFTRVPCAEEHWAQVYHRERLPGDSYPGDDELIALSDQVCFSEDAMAAIAPEHFDEAYVYYFVPSREGWSSAHRAVVCVTFGSGGPLTESWVGSSNPTA